MLLRASTVPTILARTSTIADPGGRSEAARRIPLEHALTEQHAALSPTAEAGALAYGPDLPTLADLEAATAATAAVFAAPAATAADRIAAAEAEGATLAAYARRPEAEAVLQAGIG